MKKHNVSAYENLHKSYSEADDGGMNTMYALKKEAFLGITGMMFNDGPSDWGHAYTILSAHKDDSFELPNNTFLGVSTDKFGNVHYEYISPITLYKDKFAHLNTTEAQFSQKNLIAIPDNAAIIKEYNNQKSKLANEKAILNDFNSVSEKAEKLYKAQLNTQKDAQNKVTQAQNDLDKAKTQLESSQSNLAQLKQALQDATDKVTLAKGILNQAEVALENVNADTKTKLDNLNKAKAKLQDVQNKLDQAKSDLAQAVKTNDGKKADLENQIAKLNDLKDQLRQKQALLESYQNAGVNLVKAKEAYLTKQTEYITAKHALAIATENLDRSKAEYEAAKAILTKVESELAQLKVELTQAQVDLVTKEKEQSEKEQRRYAQEKEFQRVETELIARTGKKDQDRTAKADKLAVQSNIVSSKKEHKDTQYTAKRADMLPQTGDKSENAGIVSLGLTMLLGMLGASIFRKKHVK
ncbi:hypothetical protein LmYK1_01530 [Ligilactobacillus murinus]|uniref:SEC10/PgrA surface exclusion domain-containing protein n=1 Tax=Ligilactobacillus murinus TaxID=1622 RepID=UPI0014346471|nr:SEC10/PgrA surface exclusion domain-containing protein [Ligilactobacillus murinus]BDI00913.1 hypothetical protein LmYK1_01530 [Ligilactobacillus murinus]GFI63754.1 chromosome partition protein Smc [Lactobacillaceae bacterium]